MPAAYRSPWMTDELELLRATARRFFEEEVAPRRREAEQRHGIDRAAWRRAGELGLLCMSMPGDCGGQDASFAHEIVMVEEQCRICDTSFGFVPGALNAPHVLNGMGTPEQRQRWLPPIARGEAVLAVAITEPDAGTDIKTLRTRARRDGDDWVLSGNKIFITHGRQAELALVAARTGGEGAKGISVFMVETRRQPGWRVSKVLEKIGQNGLDTCEIFLDDIRVPADHLIGGVEGRGFGGLMQVFIRERLAIAAVGVATAERAIELAVEHARQRRMFEQTLWDFQNTRFTLAQCKAETRAARVFLDELIHRESSGGGVAGDEAAMAKYWCSEVQCKTIDACLQLFGGYGYMMEYPIAQLFVDARVARIYGGSNETMKELIARAM